VTARSVAAGVKGRAERSALCLGASASGRRLLRGAVVIGGPACAPAVALTFDDGPDPDYTERFLASLGDAPSTFFVLGARALERPDLVRRILEEGHEVASHGHAHARLTTMDGPTTVLDLQRAHAAVAAAAGVSPTFYRPPHGRFTASAWREAGRLGMRRVLWSASAGDWRRGATPQSIAERALAGAKPGAVILMHDAGGWPGRAGATLDALPLILDGLRERGLRPVTLTALLDGKPSLVRAA
jgi:peptidoglycan/xylan/chitin deacetylase (PgdA/CDA1 family)